jgi:ABC-type branched-subunit amino acid transport system substrate-binding protein
MASSHKNLKRGAALLGSTALVLSVAPAAMAQDGEPIKVGHLNYYTGPFADVGDWFAATTAYTVDLINEDPPLGRPYEVIEDDIGTDGEGPVALRLLEGENVDILLNPAHGYSAYREAALEYVADNDAPLMPTVHGGGIPPSIGGTAGEPIFKAQPQDSGQSSVAIIEAVDRGAETIAIIATQVDGSQFMKDAAISGAEAAGLEIVEILDVGTTLPDYSSEVNRVIDAEPDAIFIASQAQDGGTMVKQFAEAGFTDAIILGSSEWTGTEFVDASTPEGLQAHEAVLVAGWAPQQGPAFEAYEAGWNASEYADVIDPANSYNIAYHDALVLTALTIEKAGEVSASSYANTIRDVAMAPGTQCYTYAECLGLIRAGEDIDYEGTSGSTNFTETGVVDGNPAVQEWQFDEEGNASLEIVSTPDAGAVAELENIFNASLDE